MDFKRLNTFLSGLSKNNSKVWFDENRTEYELLRVSWIEFIDSLLMDLQKFDSGLIGLEAKKCIFRINKDVRFSKDKSPYKTNFGAIMNPGGKKEMFSGYYFHFDPKEIFIAGGAYQPSPELLSNLRQEIDYNLNEFKSIVENKSLVKRFGKLQGEKLVRPPKGYELDNPAIEYLKFKSFILVQNFKLSDLTQSNFKVELLKSYEALKPFNDFINRCIPN
jgi:uncharacterized protein (TIGR02453 family)